jgi:hypothetical protein
MLSPCLSAAGLRFLDHPLPTEEFSFPYGRRTGWRGQRIPLVQTALGFPRSARTRCDRGGCPLYSGAMVSVTHPGLRDVPTDQCRGCDTDRSPVRRLVQPMSGGCISRSLIKGSFAFTRPVFPLPVVIPPGLAHPWAFPPCFTLRRYQRRMGRGNRRWTLA